VIGQAVEEFEAQRPRLFGIAYRMLGEAAEAEDVVQDAYLRWAAADHATTAAPAWLNKVVVNLCLNRLTSARARREAYVGPWLPEPVLTADGTLGPLETVEQRDLVSLAMLTLMERLTPRERAVFVLREAFGYSHRKLAGILGVSEAHARQLHRRARQRLGDPRRRFEPDHAAWRRLVERFLAAARGGDVAALRELLAADVTSTVDSGGKIIAARRLVVGGDRVARYLPGAMRRLSLPNLRFVMAEVNGGPGVLAFAGGTLRGVIELSLAGQRIQALRICANPDKLVVVARQATLLSRPGRLLGFYGW
jgi:RNA polymerase sigma-70 factor (TIGR02957 family)